MTVLKLEYDRDTGREESSVFVRRNEIDAYVLIYEVPLTLIASTEGCGVVIESSLPQGAFWMTFLCAGVSRHSEKRLGPHFE